MEETRKLLPIGRTRIERYADCTIVLHVIGYHYGHEVWEEKSRRIENNHY